VTAGPRTSCRSGTDCPKLRERAGHHPRPRGRRILDDDVSWVMTKGKSCTADHLGRGDVSNGPPAGHQPQLDVMYGPRDHPKQCWALRVRARADQTGVSTECRGRCRSSTTNTLYIGRNRGRARDGGRTGSCTRWPAVRCTARLGATSSARGEIAYDRHPRAMSTGGARTLGGTLMEETSRRMRGRARLAVRSLRGMKGSPPRPGRRPWSARTVTGRR